ncbi:MAG: prolipoprotein diacylglyceryl transferase, partial [Chloroflexota bacterium]
MMKEYGALIRAWPLYWILILVGALGLLTLYAVHLATGFVPDRVAFSVFDLPVYWYGMIIAAGIGLGAYLVGDLATARAQRLFAQTVPRAVAKRPLSTLPLADDIQAHLQRQKLATLGDLLWLWGSNPAQLSLPAADRERVAVTVGQEPAVDPLWLEQPAWSRWSADHVWNGLLLCLVLGIIGARLYHIMTPSPSMTAFSSFQDYLNNPGQIFNLRRGGLGIYGG